MRVETHRFAEAPGGPHRLAVKFTKVALGQLRQVATTWDGELIDADPRRDAVAAPWVYHLPDGRLLWIRLATTHLVLSALDVRIDGRPQPGSAFAPDRYLRRSATLLAVCAVAQILSAPYLALSREWPERGVLLVFGLASASALAIAATALPRARIAAGTALGLTVARLVASLVVQQPGPCIAVAVDVAAVILAADAFRRARWFAAEGLSAGS